jgi:L-galactose dehydrogenase
MEYRVLGKTGLRVSALGFGGSPLGGVFGTIDEATCRTTVRAALDAGINFLDTAPYYGDTAAETMLGRALRGIERSRFVVATKVGRYGLNAFDFSAARVTRSIDESLTRLGLDTIDLIQVHDVEFGSLEQITHETLPALALACAAGKARFIGVSGLPLATLDLLAARPEVACLQSYSHGTLYDSTLTRWLPRWEPLRLGCINSAPLGMGLLTEQGPPAWHPAPPALKEACRAAAALCRQHGAHLPHLALHHSTHLPGVHTTVVGLSSPTEVRTSLEAFQTAPDPDLLARVRELLAPVQDMSWPSGRSVTPPCA